MLLMFIFMMLTGTPPSPPPGDRRYARIKVRDRDR